jgi:intracellular septation protein
VAVGRGEAATLASSRGLRDNAPMGLLFDVLPILAFFVALKFSDVYIATGVAVVATIATLVYQKLHKGKIETMTLVSAGLMLVFGGLTIALHDETFVKWKPTVLQLLFAAVFIVSRFVGDKPIAQRLLGKAFAAERPVWLRVNDGLAVFCIAVAGLNLWVAYSFSTDTWATFKLFGLIGLNIVALVIATLYLDKRGKRLDPSAPETPAPSETLPKA